MLVRNWMKRNPITVTSDTLVSKAKRILLEQNLRGLPVVDDGRLRGLLTRVACMRAGEFVARTEDPHEFSYYVNRLKVKDLMVRNPHTLSADDTMETCLRRGQEEKISQYPVMENGNVVGLVSDAEVFFMTAQVLGVPWQWSGITLAPVRMERGTMGRIAKAVEETGATLQSIFPVCTNGEERTKVVVKFTGDADKVAAAVAAGGFDILDVCPAPANNGAGDKDIPA
jgi:acetoin utilization protein AcuB